MLTLSPHSTIRQSLSRVSSLLGLKVKIFVAMGILCLLLALIAGLALRIINGNLALSDQLLERGQALSKRVEEVGANVKGNLTAQQERQVQSANEREQLGQARLEKQIGLYQMLLDLETSLGAVNRNANKILIDSAPYSVVAKEVDELRAVADKFFALPDLAALDEKKVKGASRAVKAYLGTYDEVKALDAENVSMTQQVDKVKRAMEIGATLRERVTVLVQEIREQAAAKIQQENEEAQAKLATTLAADQETMNAILASQGEIRQSVINDVEANSAMERFLRSKRTQLLFMAVLALGLGVAFSLVIVALISRPVQRAVNIAKGIAEGDLEQEVDITGNDEIGQLGQSLSVMIENLRTNRNEVEGNVHVLDDVASTVSAAVEEVSASMNEINSTTHLNVQKAQMTHEMSSTAKANAEEGKARMGEMVRTINEVRTASQEITKTIKTINDIAFQTNLLALNAAVEAAHAGEQGLGFAVVAEEVRSLAGRCAQAANDTTTLLEGPLKKIGLAVEVAGKTSSALDSICDNVNAMGTLVEDIVTGSEMQAAGIKQITIGLEQIDVATQGLASQADQLTATLDRYKKPADGTPGGQLQLSQ